MSAPLVVSIPHRLGREEASRRLKAGLTRAASSIPVLKVDEERWEENRMIFRVRAGAGGVRPSRCGGRSCPPRSHITLVVAAICASSASRDQESRQSAADQTELTNNHRYCSAAQALCCRAAIVKNFFAAYFVSVLVTNSTEDQTLRGRREPTSHGSRHDIRQAVRPSIPGGLLFFKRASPSTFVPASRRPRIWPSTRRRADAGTEPRGALPSCRPRDPWLRRNSLSG